MQYARVVDEYFKENGFDKFFSEFVQLDRPNDKGEQIFFCPFHGDKQGKSGSVNKKTGLWHCFGCDIGGDIFGFFTRIDGDDPDQMNVESVAKKIAQRFGIVDEITADMVQKMHQDLIGNPALLEMAVRQLGIDEPTIKRFSIGWASGVNRHYKSNNRFSIPIPGMDGDWEDCRLYNRQLDPNLPKILPWKSGQGSARPYPIPVLKREQFIVFLEGEKDVLRAHKCGIDEAVTSTSGAGQIAQEYLFLFKDKDVFICQDIDEEGEKAAVTLSQKLMGIARSIKIVRLPKEGMPPKGDFSDWADIVGDQNVKREFKRLADAAEVIVREREEKVTFDEVLPDAEMIDFCDIPKLDLHDRRITVKAHTVGASIGMKEFLIPLKIDVYCGRDQGKVCNSCRVMATPVDEMPLPVNINPSSEQSLSLIRVSANQKLGTMKRIVGVPDRCGSVHIVERVRTNVQMQLLSDPIETDKMKDTSSSHRMAYYHGDPIKDNADYHLTGYLQADPKSQETVFNIQTAQPVRSVLESFSVSDATRVSMAHFKCETDVATHMRKIYDEIETATGIVGRIDVQRCVLFSIFSALTFKMGNKTIESGWIESLILGDSRTGKSALAKNIMRIVNVGEFISCENLSAAGLIGGIQIMDGIMCPVWGKFPQNDRGFMVLDEMGELDPNIMGRLSSLRSSGRAEIQKIQQATTNARVRLVMVGNPQRGMTIPSYDCGVRSITGVIKNMEDIARFTLATTVSAEDVSVDDILADRPISITDEVKSYYNDMAMLTWSLTSDQIVFDDAANLFVRGTVREMCKKYHSSIPLVDKGSFMEKLARCCIPVAILCGSIDVDADNRAILMVREEHARYAARAMQEIFDGKAMAYDKYSKQEYAKETLGDEKQILQTLSTHYQGNKMALIRFFLSNNAFSINSLIQLIGFRPSADSIWSTLLSNHAIIPKGDRGDRCVKTPAFTKLLEEVMQALQDNPEPPRSTFVPEDPMRTRVVYRTTNGVEEIDITVNG